MKTKEKEGGLKKSRVYNLAQERVTSINRFISIEGIEELGVLEGLP